MKLIDSKKMDLPGNHIVIKSGDANLGFSKAKDMAKSRAQEICEDPMLLSWYRGDTGESYPDIECGRGNQPAWIVYAESRGGDIAIDVNDGQYIFIYLSLP